MGRDAGGQPEGTVPYVQAVARWMAEMGGGVILNNASIAGLGVDGAFYVGHGSIDICRHIARASGSLPHCLSPRPDTAGFHPRWGTPFEATKRLVGLIVLLLAASLVSPFPFGHIVPVLALILVSLAYLEEDGALLRISLGAALGSFAITLATVWATIRAPDLLEGLRGVIEPAFQSSAPAREKYARVRNMRRCPMVTTEQQNSSKLIALNEDSVVLGYTQGSSPARFLRELGGRRYITHQVRIYEIGPVGTDDLEHYYDFDAECLLRAEPHDIQRQGPYGDELVRH